MGICPTDHITAVLVGERVVMPRIAALFWGEFDRISVFEKIARECLSFPKSRLLPME
jgi:hypothetical protein